MISQDIQTKYIIMPKTKKSTLAAFKGRRTRSRTSIIGEGSTGEITSVSSVVTDSVDKHTECIMSPAEERVMSPAEEHIMSPAEKKISQYKHASFYGDEETNEELSHNGNRIVSFTFLDNLFSQVLCPVCKKATLEVKEYGSNGMVRKMNIYCVLCEAVVYSKDLYTSDRLGGETSSRVAFELNFRIVSAMKEVGLGEAGLRKLCEVIDIPPGIYKEAFGSHVRKYEYAATTSTQDMLVETSSIIKTAYQHLRTDGSIPDDGIYDIAVSFDGSWHTRGFTSHHGIATAIDLLTGLIIDYEVVSNYCHGCQYGEQLPADSQDKTDWLEQHEPMCDKNFYGHSKSMEGECAKRIWGRSIAKKLRYTTFLGDGDSAAFNAVKKLKPYGDVEVKKEECVNHVSKRLKNCMEKAIMDAKTDGVRLGGRGRLTAEKIRLYQNYYGRAIKDNKGNKEQMKNSIWAILLHGISTDSEPHHQRCPTGITSWCWYQRQLAGIVTARKHRPSIPKDVGEKLIPAFHKLADSSLLERCLLAKTQNANEVVNSKIWQRCLKVRFCGLPAVKAAVARGVSEYNKGATTLFDMLNVYNIPSIPLSLKSVEVRDKERIKQSAMKDNKKARQKRKERTVMNLRSRATKEKDGAGYEAGGF